MNKKIKFIIATTLSILVFSAFQPSKYSTMITEAYAAVSTYALADRGELKSLEVKSTDGKSLELCDDFDGYKKNLTDEKTYYVSLDQNSDGVKIFAESAGDDYIVKVFESDRKNATAHNAGENISLQKGTSTLYIRTFTSEEAFKRAEKKKDVTNCDKTYKININKRSLNESDEIYIGKLTLKSEYGQVPVNFNKNTLTYNIAVKEDIYELTIKANPEDEDADYTVKIDGLRANDDNEYERTIPLKKGKNQIKINITDDGDKTRTYTLNVTRGVSLTSAANVSASQNNQISKTNQWIKINNKWQYNDSTGQPLKNTWFYDRNSGKNYYLQADGTMAANWLNYNGYWYYLNESGERQTGWQLINGEWYYLDSEGIMKTGWILDLNKKYYYLQENGVMAKNVTIDGYKLGADGVWIK